MSKKKEVEKEVADAEPVVDTEIVPVEGEDAEPQENLVIRQVTVSLMANESINIGIGTHGMTRLEASAMLSKAFTALTQPTV